MGYQAGHGKHASAPFNQAAENIILGYQAGYLIENGTTNVIIGKEAGYAASGSVSVLTAIGHKAGYRSTSGYSVYVGRNAGEEETGAYGNTHVGNHAGSEQQVREEEEKLKDERLRKKEEEIRLRKHSQNYDIEEELSFKLENYGIERSKKN